MKTRINNTSMNRLPKRFSRSGFTLIEISLVIALLLGLIAVAFIGLGSYRKGSDKAKCKMQLSAVQKAVRGHANMRNLTPGAPLLSTDVFGAGKIMETEPKCPYGTDYAWSGTIPAVGIPYGNCAQETGTDNTHVLDPLVDTTDW